MLTDQCIIYVYALFYFLKKSVEKDCGMLRPHEDRYFFKGFYLTKKESNTY